MNDPTYRKEDIDANPIWKRAFYLSEMENDNAPIGWSNYIKQAAEDLEPDYEFEGCPQCENSAAEEGIEYEHNATWNADQSTWVCSSCGGLC